VLRTLATASRSLRLYPAASPIPRQSVTAVEETLADLFSEGGRERLTFTLARDGFESEGEPVATNVPGREDFASDLREHGISELHFSPGVTADDILTALVLLSRPADEIRGSGGFGAALAAESVSHVGVTGIVLQVVDGIAEEGAVTDVTGGFSGAAGADYAMELAEDPAKLGQWLYRSAGMGRADLLNGLTSLIDAVGPVATDTLAASFAQAFAGQTTDSRDTLLSLAMDPGPFRDLMGAMFCHQSAGEIASSMLAGSFGRNMLSLSAAMSSLPLDRLDEAVRAQVQSMLPTSGHSDAEARFLDHMIEVRKRTEPEPALATTDHVYVAVAEAAAIRQDDLAKARHAVEASGDAVDAAGVRTMLTLLDQQSDPAQAQECAANLASLIAHLLGGHKVMLADFAIAELTARDDRIQLEGLLQGATAPGVLGSLLDAVLADSRLEDPAGRILRALGENAVSPLVTEAVARKTDGIALAERLLGRRMLEHLNSIALHTEHHLLRPIVARLALEGDSRSLATVMALKRRPDPIARKEIVEGLAEAGGSLAQTVLGELVADADNEVAIMAARSLARTGRPGSGDPIAARISQIDIDHADFDLGRELIVALSRTPDRSADELLARLASRRALIKRGRFNEVQQIVAAAIQARGKEAVNR
jgi:hypothetical protein